jgi:DnaK suppressor protein
MNFPTALTGIRGDSEMKRQDAVRKLRANLLRRREGIRRALEDARSQLHTSSNREVGDAVDVALDAEHHEISSQLAQVESAELAQIDIALDRITTGDYGVCVDCGRSIPLARLQALPYATSCIKCQCGREVAGGGTSNTTLFAEPGENDLLLNGNGASVS